MADIVPDFPPRCLRIYWEAGKDLVIESEGFAPWEITAIINRLAEIGEGGLEQEQDDQEEADDRDD